MKIGLRGPDKAIAMRQQGTVKIGMNQSVEQIASISESKILRLALIPEWRSVQPEENIYKISVVD